MIRSLPVILVLAAMAAIAFSFYQQGRQHAETETIKQNQEAENAADKASSVFGRCVADGGVFDFATGKCRRD